MKKTWIMTTVAAISLAIISMPLLAASGKWQIVPDESSITFTGTQNDAPASGSFKKFSGDITFDPAHLDTSKVHLVIDVNSIMASYSAFTSTLLSADWFNAKLFPQAVFDASHFTKQGDNQYQATGTLTVRDKTQPVTLTFSAEDLGKNKERVTGSTTVKRTPFGVGQGEWADTDAVKDEVQVKFSITATSG